MASNVGSGKGSSASVTDLHKGLSDKAAKAVDGSMKLGKTSVNENATRTSVAPTPKSLGPRNY